MHVRALKEVQAARKQSTHYRAQGLFSECGSGSGTASGCWRYHFLGSQAFSSFAASSIKGKTFPTIAKLRRKRGNQTGTKTTISMAAASRQPLETPALSRKDRISSGGSFCEVIARSGLSRSPAEPRQQNAILSIARFAYTEPPFFTSPCSITAIPGHAVSIQRNSHVLLHGGPNLN